MERLFDISSDFAELFDKFDEIQEMEFEKNEDGDFVDALGNVVDPELYRAEMLQAWFDTLTGIEEEFKFKAENVAQYIKSLRALAEDVKVEEDKLKKRRKQYEYKAQCMVEYLKMCMEQMNLTKIDMPKAKITMRNNAPSLVIVDEMSFVSMLQEHGRDDLLKYSMPEIRRNDIKKLIKQGESFEATAEFYTKNASKRRCCRNLPQRRGCTKTYKGDLNYGLFN